MKTITFLLIVSLLINGVLGDEVSVMDGDSVTLHTNDAGIETAHNLIVTWTFGSKKDTSIAYINRAAKIAFIAADVFGGIFRDRLKLNDQTGDLTITNITTQHTGPYEVQIQIGSKIKDKSFNVNNVSNPESDQLKSVSVKNGDSVTLLADDRDIKKYDLIQWRFQGSHIAHFNKSASEISKDERFRDKLQLDVSEGSLKIKNIRMDLSGLYKIDLTRSSSSYTIHQSFTVTVSGEVKSVSVMKGDPLIINTDVPDIKTYDRILFIFGCDDTIADVNRHFPNKQFTLDGKDRDRLKLNDQTGDLTITKIKIEDAGDYELKMSSSRRTIQRRFRVNVSEPGLSPSAVAGLSVFFLLFIAAAAAGGVIFYRRKIAKLLGETKILEVNEGKSVDLKTEVTDIQKDDVIEWRFKETLIAEINPANNIFRTYDGDKGLFRDKLTLNDKTGDLIIKDIRREHTGVYKLKFIRNKKTSYRRISVSIRYTHLYVDEGESVNLQTKVTDIQRDDVIEWRFKRTLIAEINPANNIFSTYDGDKGLFRDKLKLNHQTGDLNINDIRQKHDGVYKLKIIRDGKTSNKIFIVFVRYTHLYVDEGESVNLQTKVTDIKRDDLIEWRFGFRNTLIAEINPANNIFTKYNDDLFRGKLELNDQTGDLTINNIRQKHEGVYKLKITRDGKTSYKIFIVSVRAERLQVDEGESVDLKTEVTDIQIDDVIEWRFRETLIAKINPVNNIFSTYDGDKGLFRDKLKLNHQTGDLNINDIREEHDGDYTLWITRDGKTSYKIFTVSVIYKTEKLQLNEGSSVDLKTKIKNIKKDDVMEWRFGETLIAEINPANNIFSTYDDDDDLFRDKLKLNHQTGDLTINDIREEHKGGYKLKIIRDGKASYKRFRVHVTGQTKILDVDEGTSADLKTYLTDIQRVEKIEWRSGETLIAEINPANNIFSTYDGDYGLLKGKLKLNHQTGDLTINDFRWQHTGDYTLKIIRNGETKDRRFNVFVINHFKEWKVDEGDSVDLETDLTDIQTDDLIEWTFRGTLIAKINPANNIFSTYDDYDLFKDKLRLNHQTGDLNINDMREEHCGVYILKIIRGETSSCKKVIVFFRGEVKTLYVCEGESADLKTEVTDIQKDDLIEWRFADEETKNDFDDDESLIAEINPANWDFNPCDYGDGWYSWIFRNKLKLNRQTGDLNINDIRREHTGVYLLKITRDGISSDKRFRVMVICETKPLQVYEGESVDLKTEVKDIKRDDVIEWRFENEENKRGFDDEETLIAANNISSIYDGDDDLFRDKLKLNDQTGDLNIKDIKRKHTGEYILKITREGKNSYKRFNVFVRDVKGEIQPLVTCNGRSVTLKNNIPDPLADDVMVWFYGETFIAKSDPARNVFCISHGCNDLFRDKLEQNHQTGDLTIKNFRQEHAGVYTLKIERGGLFISRSFGVLVNDNVVAVSVDEGKSYDLKTDLTDIQKNDLIEWTFRGTLIAKINFSKHIFSLYEGDDDLFRGKLKMNHKTGDLNINDIMEKHTGVYTLKIIKGGETSDRRFIVTVRASEREDPVETRGDPVEAREDPVEAREDPVEAREDPVETRGRDSVRIEMQPLLNNSSQ